MEIRRPYIIYLLIFIWSIFSNILSITDSFLVSRIWQITTFILIGMTALAIISHSRIFSNRLGRFALIWMFYASFINLFFLGNSDLNYLETFIDVNWWTSIFILFYSIFIKDHQDKFYKSLIKLFPLFYFIIFALVSFKIIFYFGSVNFGVIEVENINSVYWILLLVPFAFLLENKVLKYVILLLSFILIIASTKRGATIAISLVILISLMQDTLKWKKLLRNLILGITITFGFFLIFEKTISKLDINVLERFKSTDINEEPRMYLITESWEKFEKKDLRFQLFGSGHRSTAIDRGAGMLSKTSHNDYFEVLYNYGVLGLTLYLYFTWQILIRIKYLYKIGGKYYQAYLAAFIIFFVMSMISHLIIYPTYFAFIVIIWALIEAKLERQKKSLQSRVYNKLHKIEKSNKFESPEYY